MHLIPFACRLFVIALLSLMAVCSANASDGVADSDIEPEAAVDLVVVMKSERVLYLYDDGLIVVILGSFDGDRRCVAAWCPGADSARSPTARRGSRTARHAKNQRIDACSIP